MRRVLGVGLIALALVGVASGCVDHSFAYGKVEPQTSDPGASVSLNAIEVPEGEAAIAQVTVYDHEDVQMHDDLVSEDPTLLEVQHTVDPSTYAFLGLRAGTTQVHILANGVIVRSIPARVVVQVGAK